MNVRAENVKIYIHKYNRISFEPGLIGKCLGSLTTVSEKYDQRKGSCSFNVRTWNILMNCVVRWNCGG